MMPIRQRFNILAAIATQVALTTVSLGAAPALALDDDLFQLCSSFPYNSQCEGYEVPIPLDNRDGEAAKCLLSGADEAVGCKVLLGEDTLTAYIEFGEPITALGDQRGSSEMSFPLSAMESFEYSEDSRINVGAVVLLGLPGLFVKDKTASFNVRYISAAVETEEVIGLGEGVGEAVDGGIGEDGRETELMAATAGAPNEAVSAVSEESNLAVSAPEATAMTAVASSPQQFLFVLGRGEGRELRQQLEAATGLTAERDSIE
ncbi:MAG: hypothetical protein AAFO06_23205 [Cyanobacteria bacterium J06597_16]